MPVHLHAFFSSIAFKMIKDAQLFVRCKNDHASNWISTSQLICMISFRLFFFHFLLHLQWLYSSVVCGFFIVACIISSNDFVSLLILNLRIKDSLINIRFRNYWFKCCLVQFIKHHKFFINLRRPIFINLL